MTPVAETRSTRTEKDSFGPLEVPNDRLWGAQTQRSLGQRKEDLARVMTSSRLKRVLARTVQAAISGAWSELARGVAPTASRAAAPSASVRKCSRASASNCSSKVLSD